MRGGDTSGGGVGRTAGGLTAGEASRLRLLARQHAFGGYGRFSNDGHDPDLGGSGGAGDGVTAGEDSAAGVGVGSSGVGGRVHCTRHHAVDWNFLGSGRPRPNRWGVVPSQGEGDGAPGEGGGQAGLGGGARSLHGRRAVNEWREDAFATDEKGQPYYHEVWRRMTPPGHHAIAAAAGTPSGAAGMHPLMLAMRSLPSAADAFAPTLSGVLLPTPPASSHRDTLLIVCSGRFSYVSSAQGPTADAMRARTGGFPSRAAAVDGAILRGDGELARWLVEEDVQAGYGVEGEEAGLVGGGGGWRVQTSVQPAHEGTSLGRVLLAAEGRHGFPGAGGSMAEMHAAERAVLAEWGVLIADVLAGRVGEVAGQRLRQAEVVRLGGVEFELFECSREGG